MRKNRLLTAAAALLLVGAGCSSDTDANINAAINTNAMNAPVETRSQNDGGLQLDNGVRADADASASADATVEDITAPATIDASIDALLQDSDDEIKMTDDTTVEVETADGDKAEVNAFGSASYADDAQ